ncbi:MAG: Lrp/AsnC family transcriptional regulator [Candidatus Bathyarchaeota archaeon]|jgi:DNA-binding Lrp family transcriptional regulator
MGKRSGVNKIKLTSLLLEYLKDSSRTDRQMAKILGVSQPTISRMRNRLLQEGLVRHFSAIPDFAKLGYEIMVFSFVKFDMERVMEIEEKAREWAQSYPEIIFSSRAEGMGMDTVTVSLHKNYAEFMNFLMENKNRGRHFMAEVNYILVDLGGNVTKPLSFKYLAEKKEK